VLTLGIVRFAESVLDSRSPDVNGAGGGARDAAVLAGSREARRIAPQISEERGILRSSRAGGVNGAGAGGGASAGGVSGAGAG